MGSSGTRYPRLFNTFATTLGGDTVGMSNANESVVARHMNARVLSINLITNIVRISILSLPVSMRLSFVSLLCSCNGIGTYWINLSQFESSLSQPKSFSFQFSQVITSQLFESRLKVFGLVIHFFQCIMDVDDDREVNHELILEAAKTRVQDLKRFISEIVAEL